MCTESLHVSRWVHASVRMDARSWCGEKQNGWLSARSRCEKNFVWIHNGISVDPGSVSVGGCGGARLYRNRTRCSHTVLLNVLLNSFTIGLRCSNWIHCYCWYRYVYVFLKSVKVSCCYFISSFSKGTEIQFLPSIYLAIGTTTQDIKIGGNNIEACMEFKYLGVTFTHTGSSHRDIFNKIAHGKKAIQLLTL
jgi:hypothetical protein